MRKKTALIAGIAAAGLAVGIGFPSLTAKVLDFRIEKREEALSSDSVTLSMNSQLQIGQKLAIVDDCDSVVQLDAAQSLSAKEAEEKVYSDIDEFWTAMGWELDIQDLKVKDAQILLYMSSGQNASGSVLTWKLTLQDADENQVEVWLDDETGQMVKLQALASALAPEKEVGNKTHSSDEVIWDTPLHVQTELLGWYLGEYYGYQYGGILAQSYDSFDLYFYKDGGQGEESFDVSVTYAYDKIFFND